MRAEERRAIVTEGERERSTDTEPGDANDTSRAHHDCRRDGGSRADPEFRTLTTRVTAEAQTLLRPTTSGRRKVKETQLNGRICNGSNRDSGTIETLRGH